MVFTYFFAYCYRPNVVWTKQFGNWLVMEDWQKHVKTVANRVLDTILPPRCIISGEEVESQGQLSSHVWAGLDFISDPFCDCCGYPFDFDTGADGALCANCLHEHPDFDKARSALKYNEMSRNLILGFKHGDNLHAVLSFMPWLKAAGQEFLSEADYLVPVPLHNRRLLMRRYNQAAIITQRLGKETGVNILLDGLMRCRNTKSQGHLKAGERAKNVRRAFEVPQRFCSTIHGKTIVLIDDVYTTGSTVNECSKALRRAGAFRINVLTVARVVKE